MEDAIRILLVEDDPDDVLLMVDTLYRAVGGARMQLESADTLRAGLEALARGGVDVVLLDLKLPDSEGLPTLLRLRAQGRGVPVVVLTGLESEELGVECLRQGAQDYLVKGRVDAAGLARAIRYAMERNRLVAQLESLLAESADGVVLLDLEGKVLYANRAAEELLGRPEAELLERPFPFPAAPGRVREVALPAREGGERSAQLRVRHGEWRGRPVLMASLRDITDIQRTEQLRAELRQRRQSDESREQFLQALSHEMRNPLAIIKTSLSYLSAKLAPRLSAEEARLLERGASGAERLLKLVQSMLELARLGSGKARIQRRPVDLRALIHDSVEGFRLLARGTPVSVEESVPESLPAVPADRDLVEQVLVNLLDNALRFARSKVRLEARLVERAPGSRPPGAAGGAPGATAAGAPAALLEGGREVVVSCVDDGPGIPPERLPGLFERFAQGPRAAGRGYKGTGLGLFLCREIVERHGGRIWVESPPGQGTRVHVALSLGAGGSPGR